MEYLDATDRFMYTTYGGARGGGKSYIERWRHVRFHIRHARNGIRGLQTGLFCNTFKEARKKQFMPSRLEFPEWLGTWNESSLEFRFTKAYGGGIIAFLNLEDPMQYKSDQFGTIGIEELTEVPNPAEIIDILSGSLRWPGIDWTPMGFTTNPDGPGHSQVKGMFLTKAAFSHPDFADKDPEQYHFIRALPTDNPHLSENYINNVLKKLPDSLRKPWLEGSWDLFQGQRFNFNRKIHVVDPFPITGMVKYYGSFDYGFDNPSAIGIYAVLPKCDNETFIYKIHEGNVSGLDVQAQIQYIKDTLKLLNITLSAPMYLDTQCWAETGQGLAPAYKFMQGGVPVQQVLKDRVNGWISLEDLLSHKLEDGEVVRQPKMKFFSNCVLTCNQITDAVWDPKKPGDIQHPESFRDDNLDETRYFSYTHFHPPKVAKQIPQDSMDYWNKLAILQHGKKARVPKYMQKQ